MKKAAVIALADLAKEPVPEQVNIAYGKTRLAFGRDYIIPKPFDPRLIANSPTSGCQSGNGKWHCKRTD